MGYIAGTKRHVQRLTTEQIWTTSTTWEITIKHKVVHKNTKVIHVYTTICVKAPNTQTAYAIDRKVVAR